MRRSFRSTLVIVSALALIFPACSSNEGNVLERVTGSGKVGSRKVRFPSQVLGLTVKKEDISSQLEEAKQPYVDSVGMFSMREGELLRATFQVSRMNRVARPGSKEFRDTIINLMGSSEPEEIKVNEVVVFNTTGNQQDIFAWFDGKNFFVLSIHEDYLFPRTLLRRAIELSGEL